MAESSERITPDAGPGAGGLRGTLDGLQSELPGVVYRCRNDESWTLLGITENVDELTGYLASDFIENGTITYAELILPGDRQRVWDEVQDSIGRDEPFRVTYRIRTRAGEVRTVLEQGHAVRHEGEMVLTGYIQDVTDAVAWRLADKEAELGRVRRQRRYIELLQTVTVIANESMSFEDALRSAIPEICQSIGFEVGHAFLGDDDSLRSADTWYLSPEVEGLEAFREATESGDWSFEEGLPGRVIDGGRAEWVEDVKAAPDFYRIAEGDPAPVASGVGAPVMTGATRLAVLEFYTTRKAPPDPELAAVLEQIGIQLGRVWERQRAARRLRTSERRFRQLAENVEAVFWLADLEGRTLYVSPGIERIAGEDVPIEDWSDVIALVHPEDRAELEAVFTDRDRAPYEIEYRIVRPDGEIRAIRQKAFPIRNADGEVYRVGGLAEDVTEKHRSRKRLVQTTRLLEQTIASLAEAVFVIGTGAERRTILEVNEAAERMFGYAREEMVGSTTEMLHVDRDAFERFGTEIGPVLERADVFHGEYSMRRSDGSVFAAEQTVTLLDPSEGLSGGVVSVVRDISEQKRAEDRLRASEERFRQIATRINSVFWMSSPDKDEIEYVSPAYREVWGRPPAELYHDPMKWLEAIHEEDRDRVRAALPGQPRGDYDIEYRIVRPDGEVRWIWDRAFPIEDEAGRVYRVIGVADDVTERRTLEAQLRHAQRMDAVGRLAGGIAHDFNNLLTVIRAQSDLLLLDLPTPSPLRDEVDVIRDASDRAARLTRQLLAFSREQVLRPRIVDINEIVEGLEHLVVRVIGEQIRVETSLAQSIPPIRVDPGQIEQVLLNLVVNARDAMPDGGVLSIATAEEVLDEDEAGARPGLQAGRNVRIVIEDDGVGMDESTRARVFEPFFTTKKGGTGLGMAMSYGIVKQSGGSIHVDSEPGVGTRFLIRFPVTEGKPEAVTPKRTRPAESEAMEGTVLLVEDDASVRRIATRILERAGFDVREAADAERGAEILEEAGGTLDLILTDLGLPGMSGLDLVERVRDRFPDLPVIVMSGYAEPSSQEEAGGLPHDVTYIQKPFSADGLRTTVQRILAGG